jgi:hypothetical protein
LLSSDIELVLASDVSVWVWILEGFPLVKFSDSAGFFAMGFGWYPLGAPRMAADPAH